MRATTIALILFALLWGTALADDDCDDPVSRWQPRENLRHRLEAEGWRVYRIKVDDGCYEVRGRDASGRSVEASYTPASLKLVELEYEEDEDDDEQEAHNHDRSETR